jgi:hypothetical protein
MDKTIIEIRPIADSENSKTNAYSHYCNSVMHSKNYAVCLHLIKQRKSGRLDIRYADCSASIGKKICPALAMRKEEIAENRSIYFKERIKHMGESFMDAATDLIGTIGAKVTKTIAKIDKSPVTKKDDFQPSKDGYSTAINNALSKKVETKVEVKKQDIPVKTVTPIVGESLIEMAKRMMQANA